MAAGQARIEAQKHAEELRQAFTTRADSTRASCRSNEDGTDRGGNKRRKVGDIEDQRSQPEVGNVKTEVQSAKSELEKTIQDLRRVRGDLDGTSSLVATNGKELSGPQILG